MKTLEQLKNTFEELVEDSQSLLVFYLSKYDPVDKEINLRKLNSTFLDEFGNTIISVGVDNVWAEDESGEMIEGSIDDLDMHSVLFTIETLVRNVESDPVSEYRESLIGRKAKVIARYHGHDFNIGDTVVLGDYCRSSGDWECFKVNARDDEDSWFLQEDELKILEDDGTT